MMHLLMFTLLFLVTLGFLVGLLYLCMETDALGCGFVVLILAIIVFFVGIAGCSSMSPPQLPTTVQVRTSTFEPDNINSASVRFVNSTSQLLVLCLAEHWRCNSHLPGWCQPSYQFPGWVADWFPGAFIDCTATEYVKLYPHQQVVINFDTADHAYEITAQGHQGMKLVLMNPVFSGRTGGGEGG